MRVKNYLKYIMFCLFLASSCSRGAENNKVITSTLQEQLGTQQRTGASSSIRKSKNVSDASKVKQMIKSEKDLFLYFFVFLLFAGVSYLYILYFLKKRDNSLEKDDDSLESQNHDNSLANNSKSIDNRDARGLQDLQSSFEDKLKEAKKRLESTNLKIEELEGRVKQLEESVKILEEKATAQEEATAIFSEQKNDEDTSHTKENESVEKIYLGRRKGEFLTEFPSLESSNEIYYKIIKKDGNIGYFEFFIPNIDKLNNNPDAIIDGVGERENYNCSHVKEIKTTKYGKVESVGNGRWKIIEKAKIDLK
ncbi:hypothetical protein ACQ1Q9_00530 [Ornithobacterium rhinotracheale]